jgi:hypothetical protein
MPSLASQHCLEGAAINKIVRLKAIGKAFLLAKRVVYIYHLFQIKDLRPNLSFFVLHQEQHRLAETSTECAHWIAVG